MKQVGGWLFRHRGWLPVPVVVAVVGVAQADRGAWAVGVMVIVLGECLRLWGVAYIGSKSRTRSSDVGSLCRSGPYRFGRNPLYVGNIAVHFGLAWMSGYPALALAVGIVFGVYYNLIVFWEEEQLTTQLGSNYERYLDAVPRWFGIKGLRESMQSEVRGDWLGALRSERSTLVALLGSVGALMVWSSWGWGPGAG